MSLSTWYLHSPCGRCFLNCLQGVCGIQMESPILGYLKNHWTHSKLHAKSKLSNENLNFETHEKIEKKRKKKKKTCRLHSTSV